MRFQSGSCNSDEMDGGASTLVGSVCIIRKARFCIRVQASKRNMKKKVPFVPRFPLSRGVSVIILVAPVGITP